MLPKDPHADLISQSVNQSIIYLLSKHIKQ